MDILNVDPIRLFGDYMKVNGVPKLEFEPGLPYSGKKLGVVNGSSWISLWSTWFGRKFLPGAKIINSGNEAVQLNFMHAHRLDLPCPPQINIDLFCRHARDLFELAEVDAVLISCSTMNRAHRQVRDQMAPLGVPVVQIDEAMMEEAVLSEGRVLVVATHGPTVSSTQSLLRETADRMGRKVRFTGATVEEAFHQLGRGEIEAHNRTLGETIRRARSREQVDIVVLAQLSMSVFSFSHPDPMADFGVRVLNSGETGFRRAAELLQGNPAGRCRS